MAKSCKFNHADGPMKETRIFGYGRSGLITALRGEDGSGPSITIAKQLHDQLEVHGNDDRADSHSCEK